MLNEKIRYAPQDDVETESFEDGSLILKCSELELIQLNKTAQNVLELLDGRRNIGQIIKDLAESYQVEEQDIRMDIHKLVNDWGEQSIIKPIVKIVAQGSFNMSEIASYLVNPDISLREENGDGAILYKADTDALLLINPIGLLIWKYLRVHPRTQEEINNHLRNNCVDVPSDKIEADIGEFLKDLHAKGFIGKVIDE